MSERGFIRRLVPYGDAEAPPLDRLISMVAFSSFTSRNVPWYWTASPVSDPTFLFVLDFLFVLFFKK